jgi:UDP:flavonoid glycosyltransferase YjiC (YdhE family)
MKKKRILVCPLDWGLGHASRCVPLIRILLGMNHQVVIGGSGRSADLLKEQFPALPFIHMKQYSIRYAPAPFFWIVLSLQMPLFILSAIREHYQLARIIQKENIDLVISDNRYGLFSKKAKTVFITHQLHLILPFPLGFLEPLAENIIARIIRRYKQCWIPDMREGIRLTEKLSIQKRRSPNLHFIGILSRFCGTKFNTSSPQQFDIVATLSGPEPHRSRFEQLLVKELSFSSYRSLIVRGLPGKGRNTAVSGTMTLVDHLSNEELSEVLLQARYLICRGGYSTIMDLAALGKTALLVPTPGQTEQEYLSRELSKKAYFPSLRQSDFSLEEAIYLLEKHPPQLPFQVSPCLSESILPELIHQLCSQDE